MSFNAGNMVGIVITGIIPLISLNNSGKLLATARESIRYGSMDYVTKLDNPYSLKIVNDVAYNNFDLGNFMWGLGMSILGYSYNEAVISSQIHALIKEGTSDQNEDQKAIYNGYHFK